MNRDIAIDENYYLYIWEGQLGPTSIRLAVYHTHSGQSAAHAKGWGTLPTQTVDADTRYLSRPWWGKWWQTKGLREAVDCCLAGIAAYEQREAMKQMVVGSVVGEVARMFETKRIEQELDAMLVGIGGR